MRFASLALIVALAGCKTDTKAKAAKPSESTQAQVEARAKPVKVEPLVRQSFAVGGNSLHVEMPDELDAFPPAKTTITWLGDPSDARDHTLSVTITVRERPATLEAAVAGLPLQTMKKRSAVNVGGDYRITHDGAEGKAVTVNQFRELGEISVLCTIVRRGPAAIADAWVEQSHTICESLVTAPG